MTEKHTCDGQIVSGYHSYRCSVGAKHEHEGRWYCKTHHPPTVKAKRESREEEWRKKRNAERDAAQAKKLAADEQKRRADCYDELLEALKACREVVRRAGALGELMVVDAAIRKATGEPT